MHILNVKMVKKRIEPVHRRVERQRKLDWILLKELL